MPYSPAHPSTGSCLGNRSPLATAKRTLVLVAVSDGLERATYCQFLTNTPQAYSVVEAATLPEALTLGQTSPADLMVLDLDWPCGDSLELLTTLAAASAQRPLPVVVLVGEGQERAALAAMKLGVADYLFKADLTAASLGESLGQLMDERQRTALGQWQPSALRSPCQHYQNLVENSPDVIERFDRQFRHLYVSPILSELTGLAPEAFLGKTCRELGLDAAMVATWEAAAAAVLAKGEKQTIEFSIPTQTGVRPFEMVLAPERSTTGEVETILCISRDISDRKTAAASRQQAEQLRQELSLLEQLLDSVLAGYWDFDFQYNTAYYSPGFKAMLGYANDELPNQLDTWAQLILPDDRAAALAFRDRHAPNSEEGLHSVEIRYRHKDGSTVWVICAGQVIDWDDAKRPLRMVGCHVDITQRKQTEVQLQNLSLRLSLAMESGRIGSWQRNLGTDEVIWDQCLIDLYGFAQLGRTANYQDWRERVFADDIQWVEARHQALVDHDIPYDVEFRVWRGDGSLGWIRSSALVHRHPQGQPLSIIGINYDITERKQSEEQLRDLSLRLTMALESGGIGTWELDFTTDQVDWDQRMYAMYGHAEAGAVTFQDWRRTVHPSDVPRLDADMAAVFRGRSPSPMEFRIRRPDGELRWIRATALVERHDNGQPLRMIGTNSDITEAKRAEDQLLRTTAQLEASNHELEAFAYSVSHDLRAPLRAIDGFSLALLEDYGDQFNAEGRDYFSRIRHNVQRMGLLIDDLLRLSRVSRQTMTHQLINLSALVQEHLESLQAADPDRSVTAIIAPNLMVTGDPTLIGVAIANLIENAWKFTSHHPTARLEFGSRVEGGERIYYLSDDGAGFDMAYANKLFGVFQRLHNTDEFPGTGIGLATVQRTIHRHGGRVWAEAAVEQGATVYFTLPQGIAQLEELP